MTRQFKAVLAALFLAGGMLSMQAVGLVCYGVGGGFQTVCTTTPDGVRITFNPDGTNAGLNVGSHTADSSAPQNGDIIYNSTSNQLRARINGAWVELGGSAGNIQTLLDGISTTQGVILYYNGTDWVALSPDTDGEVLTTHGASANPTWEAASGGGDVTKIEEQTPSGTGTVTFSSLGSFTHLKVIYNARGTQTATATGINLTFNGDTGSNYDGERAVFTTSAAFAEQIAQTSVQIGVVSAASATANYASSGEILIADYRGTTFFKTAVSSENPVLLAQSTTNLSSRIHSGWWRDTSAITSITLTLTSGNYVSGSKFSLYGIN